jgi:hypothetical protein
MAAMTFCPNCGTEVEEEASFCPSCGRPLPRERAADEADASPEAVQESWADVEERPPRAEDRPTAAWQAAARPRADEPGSPPPEVAGRPETVRAAGPQRARGIDVPFTWPLTLSAWLIGVGAAVAVVALLLPWSNVLIDIGLGDQTSYFDSWGLAWWPNVILLVLLLGIAASVFLSTVVPDFAGRPTAILAILLISVGVAVDRLGFGSVAAGSGIFLLATIAAAAGALLARTGHDRPIGR